MSANYRHTLNHFRLWEPTLDAAIRDPLKLYWSCEHPTLACGTVRNSLFFALKEFLMNVNWKSELFTRREAEDFYRRYVFTIQDNKVVVVERKRECNDMLIKMAKTNAKAIVTSNLNFNDAQARQVESYKLGLQLEHRTEFTSIIVCMKRKVINHGLIFYGTPTEWHQQHLTGTTLEFIDIVDKTGEPCWLLV